LKARTTQSRIAESVGVRLFGGGVELVVGVARDVEPVAAPALAVAGRGEKAVDNLGEGVGRAVGEEGVDFVESGRKAGEIETGAADERALVGGCGGFEALGFELREDETVDLGARPFGGARLGRLRVRHRLEGPEGALLPGDDVLRRQHLAGGGPDGPVLDPGGEGVDIGGREFAGGRHPEFGVGVRDGSEDAAIRGIAGDDHGAGLTTGERVLAGVELEAAHFGVGVAGVAVPGQERADAGLEVLGGVGAEGG
jgi:hypothetical protein